MTRHRSILSTLVAMGLALSLLATLAEPGAAARQRIRTRTLAPGVKLTVIRDRSGPFRIRIVSVKLAKAAPMDVALAQDKVPGFERTSSMAVRHDALVAINGDYARSTGRPVHAFAEDGALVQTPLAWGRNFAVDVAETNVYVGHPEVSAWAYEPDSQATHVLSRVNAGAPGSKELAAFKMAGAWEEKPPSDACSARLYAQEPPRMSETQPGVEAMHVVDRVVCRDKPLWRQGGSVMSTPLVGTKATVVNSLLEGEQVSLGWSFATKQFDKTLAYWHGVLDSLGGNPTVVEDSQIATRNVTGTGWFFRRHPRTGVGYDADTGKVLLVTVDGRQPDYSVGMTLRELAEVFVSLGADVALNLDGGGSTTMVVNGNVKGRPSDGSERPVSSALLVLRGADPGETEEGQDSVVTPPPTTVSSASVWRRVASDPGSTGGLAWYLRDRGISLDPELRDAARRVDRR
ncbi:MAG: phosphodiester glycosidase family protein [Actinomycetota bacterium]